MYTPYNISKNQSSESLIRTNSSASNYKGSLKEPTIILVSAIKKNSVLIPLTTSIVIIATYTAILYNKYPVNFLPNIIQNYQKLYIPVAITSLLLLISISFLLYNSLNIKDKSVKLENRDGFLALTNREKFVKIDNNTLNTMIISLGKYYKAKDDNINRIKTLTIHYNNNSAVTYLDKEKFGMILLATKKLRLTISNPLIINQLTMIITFISTYLLAKYYDIGTEKLLKSFINFNSSDIELMAFTTISSAMVLLFLYTFMYNYNKITVEKISPFSIDDSIKAYNDSFIERVNMHNNTQILTKPNDLKSKNIKHTKIIVTENNKCKPRIFLPNTTEYKDYDRKIR